MPPGRRGSCHRSTIGGNGPLPGSERAIPMTRHGGCWTGLRGCLPPRVSSGFLRIAGKEGVMLRIAVVGCGKIADDHLDQIRRIQRVRPCKVVATCDREPLMAKQLAERFRIERHFSDPEEMLRECQTGRRPYHHAAAKPFKPGEALSGERLPCLC